MNSSFLYHAWGLTALKCTREEYKGTTTILHVESKERLIVCPKCGKRRLVKNGYRMRDFIGVPIAKKKVIIRMKMQRYKCRQEGCDFNQQENIPFATGSRSYTHRFAKYVVELLRGMTLRNVSELLQVSWDTVKEIHSIYLERHYSAFIASVMTNSPNAVHVFDHFHVVKLMNEKLDEIRRIQYHMEKVINKRKVLKGTRYLLLTNGEDIFDEAYKTRLDNALEMNKPLS